MSNVLKARLVQFQESQTKCRFGSYKWWLLVDKYRVKVHLQKMIWYSN